jgi:hypothetical protein
MVSRIRILAALVVALVALIMLAPSAALADHTQLSTFQDDAYLIDSPTSTVEHVLTVLEGLGVEQIRVNVQWATIAPDPLSTVEPSGFDPTDQADYPAANWAPYDRLVELAGAAGISVDFNITAPGPLWAMGNDSPTTRAANHWEPNPVQFYYFVYALGTRYDGDTDGIPRVSTWALWNEPNQPGWLAPQALKVHGKEVAQSPRMYRALADAAYEGLYFSGHTGSGDTILIGETAPEGDAQLGFYTPITPLPFLRDLYCVNARYQRLRGSAAAALGCPAGGSAATFVKDNPVLFYATGYAHHPYYFTHAPQVSATNSNFIPLANLGRLEGFLDSVFDSYSVHRRLPLYLTEYGYQTKPPDPYQVVTPAEQATYLNQADYIAWRNPRVRTVSQFLLYDAAPNVLFKPSQFDYWDTFQTGLLFQNGAYKPAFFSYRMPIWVPSPTFKAGQPVFIWGQVRPADRLGSQRVSILWRPLHGGYRTIASARTVAGTGYLTANVKLPGSGAVKLSWETDYGAVMESRGVVVSEG